MPGPEDRNPSNEHNVFKEDEGEYGLGFLLANEEEMAKIQEHSQYHFAQEQLEHKSDPVENQES